MDTLLTVAIQTGLFSNSPPLKASISNHQPPDRGGAVHCRILIHLAPNSWTRKTNEVLILGLTDCARKEISLRDVCHHSCRPSKRGGRAESSRALAAHDSVKESGHIKRWDMTRYLWRLGVGTGKASGTRLGNLPLSALEVVFQDQEPMSFW